MLVRGREAAAREAVIAGHRRSAVVAFKGQYDDLQVARKH
jgi:hypothetical protein